MNYYENTIRDVIGDQGFVLGRQYEPVQHGAFLVFRVQLPTEFCHGFPPLWDFAILIDGKSAFRDLDREIILDDAQRLIDITPRRAEAVPLVLVSRHAEVHLKDELLAGHPKVFCLDAADIVRRNGPKVEPYFSPLLMALRQQLPESLAQEYWIIPYLRGKPAAGWRFFGRKREISTLVSSPDNFVVVGARRIGKTSLLIELERQLQSNGYRTFRADVQDCRDERALVNRILETLDRAKYASLMRRKEIISDSVLGPALRSISGRGDAVLLIDELGNVVKNMPDEAWKVLGTIRNVAQSGGLKVVVTASQDFLLRQQQSYTGPWVNFARTMRLGAFSRDDIEDLLIRPLRIWSQVPNPGALLDIVMSAVGSNPYLLVNFCYRLFEEVVCEKATDVIAASRAILSDNLVRDFHDVVREVFYYMQSPTLQYLFLRRCQEVDRKGGQLGAAMIDDDWIEGALAEVGILSTVLIRRNILDDLSMRALTEDFEGNPNCQRIIAPLVYRVVKKAERDIDKLIKKYEGEMVQEANERGFTISNMPKS